MALSTLAGRGHSRGRAVAYGVPKGVGFVPYARKGSSSM